MDATQMICDSVLESDEEDQEQENINDRGDPLGKLCILKNEHLPEKEFPLFTGDNILGRDPNTCTLSLLAPSVSKQHATISLSVYRRKGCEGEVEALVWDLGSMNGTRKGHLKLTPNVRYALSEGDSLVVADIPCKYMKCTNDVPYTPKSTRTPATQNLKERLSEGLRENGGNLNTGSTKNTAVSTKTKDTPDSEVTRGTPARTSCLSFEQTPTQPQGTLVPDSESETDEERSKIGDRRRKNIVSDSDSYKSSPTCSTFMSPANKVVPESEDESPITPSSSYKNRTRRVVSLNEEIDININRQEVKKRDVLEIVDDSEEETGNDEAEAAFEDTHEQPELPKSEGDPSLTEGVKSATDAIPQFNMDSDTDVDEEEAAPVAINNVPASNAHFHMDSDTDVDDNDPPTTSEAPTKHSQTTSIPIVQPKGISMDSDTDVDDDDLVSAATEKPTEPPQTASTAEKAPQEFNLDSDTDVEEDSKEDETRLDINPDTSTTAAPQCLDMDSDTGDEGILSEEPVDSAKPELEIMSNSDTDVEDEVKPVTSGPTEDEAKLDSGEDTDVNESVGLPAAEGNPADATVDSDTDVEDKETDIQEAGDKQIPLLNREITPGIQTNLLQNCSTPVQAETQMFIHNDRDQNTPPKDPDQSSGLDSSVNEKDVSSTTGGDFQLELSDSSYCQAQALAMESTQAYVTVDPGLEETQPYADAITSDEKDLPVDIALQATQAYISEPFSDEEEDSAECQPTEPAPCSPVPQSNPATIEREGGKQVDVHVAETQPMCIDEEDDSEESAPFFRKRKARQIEEEETQTLTNSELSVAATQPMEIQEDEESEEDSPPVFRKRKVKQLHLEDEQTQPVNEQSGEDESTEISSKANVENLEEETKPRLDSELTVAQTQPIAMSDIEENNEDDSVPVVTKSPTKLQKQEEETTIVNSELSIAPTQPLGLSEDIVSDEEEPIISPRKRKAKPLEDTQSLINAVADPQDTKPSILKETEGEGETSNVNGRKRKGRGKQEETEVSVEPPTRRNKGRNKAVPVSRGRRGKAKVQHEDESEEEEETPVNKEDHQEADEDTKEQIRQKENEEMERLEKERVEQEEKAAKIKNEMLEREKREREEKIEKERQEREEKERVEATKRAEEELQRQEEERKKQEMEEKQRLEKEKQAETKEDAPRRGRRTGRRTTTAPDSTTLDDDDVPAKRTRSRSNSSNSLSSERSVSSVTSQNSRGRGRGRGGRRSEVPPQKTPARASNRRRTVAAETTTQTTEMSAPSPGSVSRSNSQNSEISASSVSSQGRGRGGRQRGRGRRAEPEPESVTVQSVQVTIETSLQRGRKSRKISPDNDEDDKTIPQQSGATRGQNGGKEELSKCPPDEVEDQADNEEATNSTKKNSDERRRGRKRQAEAKNETETKDHAAEEEEQKDENPTVKIKTKNTPAKKSVKDLIDDNTKPKSRGRASTVPKKKKSEEEDDSGSADSNSMEHEETPKEQEVPQTPTRTVSRKRHSAIPESSPVVKTPRSSSASPSTVGRRAGSQAYKVLFTGVVDEAGEKVLSRLGGSIAKDVTDMNYLVTDKVRRTVKFLCAVAKGVPIVTTQWLEKSGKAGTFLSPTAYIVKDREQEQKFHFSLQESLKIANSQLLLQGYEIHVTKSVKPEPVQMKDIITCSGALFLPKMPSSNKPHTLVISCEEDWSLCRPAVSTAVPVLTAEFILTGILQQKLDFETHKLSGPETTAQTAGGRGRGRKK